MMEMLVALLVVAFIGSLLMIPFNKMVKAEKVADDELEETLLADLLLFKGLESFIKKSHLSKTQIVRDLERGYSLSFDEGDVSYSLEKATNKNWRYYLVTLEAKKSRTQVILECD